MTLVVTKRRLQSPCWSVFVVGQYSLWAGIRCGPVFVVGRSPDRHTLTDRRSPLSKQRDADRRRSQRVSPAAKCDCRSTTAPASKPQSGGSALPWTLVHGTSSNGRKSRRDDSGATRLNAVAPLELVQHAFFFRGFAPLGIAFSFLWNYESAGASGEVGLQLEQHFSSSVFVIDQGHPVPKPLRIERWPERMRIRSRR